MTTRKQVDGTDPSANPTSQHTQAPNPQPQSAPKPAGFDLGALRLSQNFIETAGVEKRAAFRLGKPPKHSFFKVRGGAEYQFPTRLLEFGESKDAYLVASVLSQPILTLLRAVVLRLYVTIDGTTGIWPVPLPDPLRPNRWHTSGLEIAQVAEGRWVRMAANQGVGAYDYVAALGDLKEPAWPAAPFEEVIRDAFKDRCIASADHPVLRALRGEAP